VTGDHSSKGVLPRVLIRQRNLQCEGAKVLTRTVEPLMMIMMIGLSAAEFLYFLLTRDENYKSSF
jgi:hypothetical protein